MGNRLGRYAIWVVVAIVGAVCWGMLALARGETVNAGWLLFAAIASYAIAYRFYARFIQTRVLEADDSRATPAERLNNGRDYEPMDRRVLFGHHFAAIAGAGPLVGPVLAAQMGFLPGTVWIIVAIIAYGFIASVLPVWVLLAPRDYLSTFMKIGTILLLAVGIALTLPAMQMPRTTDFAFNGQGPVFAGSLFPFVFIIIACGALSGFHSLIASGTTPKLIQKESQVRAIGYGAMLMESFVAVMAMIAATTLDPGVYFAMNTNPAALGDTVQSAAQAVNGLGFSVSPETLQQTAKAVGEDTIIGRTGGAPTLAVGMSAIFSGILGGQAVQAFWYHFAIMFEALFILTTVDAGTRVGRFMIQDLVGNVWRPFGRTSWLPANLVASALIVAAWGYFLYTGVNDPLGGINQLFPLFGIANQLLAAVALTVATAILIKMGKLRYAWVTRIPLAWDASVTLTASWYKIFSPDPKLGFFAQRSAFQEALNNGEVLPPAQ